MHDHRSSSSVSTSHLDGVNLEFIYLRPRVISIRPGRPRSYENNPGVLTRRHWSRLTGAQAACICGR